MSRVGKKPIPLPKGVKISVGEQQVTVEGPKGKQTVPVPQGITIRQQDGTLELARDGNDKAALHGLTRALTANAVQGVIPASRCARRSAKPALRERSKIWHRETPRIRSGCAFIRASAAA